MEQAYRKLLSAFANTCPLHRHLLFDLLFWKLFCFPASTPCWTMNHDDVEQAALRLPRGHDNKKKALVEGKPTALGSEFELIQLNLAFC